MIRDASEEGNDGVILEGYTVRDLDEETIKNIGIGIYIRDLFANINFDYREEIDVNSNQRWYCNSSGNKGSICKSNNTCRFQYTRNIEAFYDTVRIHSHCNDM